MSPKILLFARLNTMPYGQRHMVEGICHCAFDRIEFRLVFDLTIIDGTWDHFFLPCIIALQPTFTIGSKYLLPEKLISNTVFCR